ncbi:MAG TPA: TonB-dependent receptor [Bryobacteraceae bacterium]|nr:TonB-dependent receptor [Bryobacteraceae bacterium]
MTSHDLRQVGCILFCMTVFTYSAFAQAVAVAEIDGHVVDPGGAAIANAEVKVTETDKQQVRVTTTDNQGSYSFPNLPVGSYQLETKADGFKSYVQSGIVLQVAQTVQINVSLQLGSISESVEVSANVNMVETKDSSISAVIDEKRMTELPLNGRNPTQLILLTGAATTAPAGDMTGSKNMQGSNGSGTFSVAGSQANGLIYLLDGGDNNDSMTNVNLPFPFPDAIEEFSVQTNALPAQYGLHPGGVVNIVTKSGSNEFHGDLFDFLRNGDLNARQDGTPTRDTLKRNQFGGVVGGRIIRDKLFFFAGFQGTQQRSNPPSTISYVPNTAALNGDFSTLEAPQSAGGCLSGTKGRLLTDPTTGAPYPNNQIPVSEFNQTALNLATKYLPNTSDPCGKVQYGIPANNPDNQWIGRVDYVRSEKHSMYGRYYIYDYTGETTFNGSNILTTTAYGNRDRSQTATYGDTYTFSPTFLNSFHATFDRRRDDRGAASNDINPATLGMNINAPVPNFFYINVSNYFSAGCGTCSPAFYNANTYQLSDDVNLIRGRHQIAFGVDARRLQDNNLTNTYTNGYSVFNGSITGDALADFLIGKPFSFEQGNPNPNTLRETVLALYVQDTFHLTSHFTLNFGVRWEPWLFPYDLHSVGDQFSLAAFEAGQHSTVYPTAPAGLVFNGDSGDPYGKSFSKPHWLTTSPRFGLVWDPRGHGKETIRISAALMHDTSEIFYVTRWGTNPPFGSAVTLQPPPGNFTNPWAGYPGGNPFPAAVFFPIGGTYISVPQNMRPPYMSQWNISYQRQLGRDWLFETNYLGNKTSHIWGAQDINPSIYIPGSSASANQRRVLYLQNPAQGQYYGAIVQADDGGNSHFNALLVSVQHRFANHFTLLTNYTWSHCTSDVDFTGDLAGPLYENPNDRAMERGSCTFDHRHNFNTSLVAMSPAIGNAFTQRLTRDWQLAPIVSLMSGAPLNISDGGVDQSKTAQGQDRPNQVLLNPYPAQQTVSEWFNPAAFALQPVGTFGNLGRDALTGPGTIQFDLALSRTFHIRERLGLDVRAEAFNILNHGNWNPPAVANNSGQFGQITTFGSPRIIQMAMKLIF